MRPFHSLYAIIVGLHADYHTGYSRFKEKYELQYVLVDPADRPPCWDKNRDQWTEAERQEWSNYLTYIKNGSNIGNILDELQEQGWTDLAVLARGEADTKIGLVFEGTLKKKHQAYEIIAPKNNLKKYKVKRYDLRKLPEKVRSDS